MSESLAGGLLPLGKRSDTGSGRVSSMSGGLIPLGKGTESGGTFVKVDKGSRSTEFGKSWRDGQASDVEDKESAGKPKSRRGGKKARVDKECFRWERIKSYVQLIFYRFVRIFSKNIQEPPNLRMFIQNVVSDRWKILALSFCFRPSGNATYPAIL